MKNFIALSVICILAYIVCPENASAQYRSVFGDSITEWSVIENGYCDKYHSLYYHTRGADTLDGKEYHVIMGSNYDIALMYYLREDTSKGKLWLRSIYSKEEWLLMDLGLNKGDTFKTISADKTILNFITDSIYYVNGLKHIQLKSKHILCGEIGEQLTFIEGTGSTAGFFIGGWRSVNEINSYLLCQHKDGIKVYSNKYFNGSCNEELGMPNPYFDLSKERVCPNPNNGEGKIVFNNPYQRNIKLFIFDMYGRLMFASSTNTISLNFSITGCAKGIYFYKLMDDADNIAEGKIMKY